MVIPLTKLIIHIENGLGSDLKGTGLAAEYNIFSRKYIWRRATIENVFNDKQNMQKAFTLLPLTSPIFILGMTYFIDQSDNLVSTPFERIGVWSYIIPVLLSFILFILFEYIMSLIRESFTIVREPSLEEQLIYFKSVDNIAFRQNDVLRFITIPYLANFLVSAFIISIVLPIVIWIYISEGNFTEFMLKLVILSIILSLVPNIIWNILIKGMLLRSTINKLEERLK